MSDPKIELKASKIAILLLHGLTGTPTEHSAVARRLHRYGFSVYCPVLAGHCTSEDDLLATGWKDWAKSAEQAFDQIAQENEVVFVGGLSAGAVLSLYLAIEKNIRGLALYSTTFKWDGWSIPKLAFLLPLVLKLPYIGSRYRFEESYPYGIMNEKLRALVVGQMKQGNAEAAGFTGTPGASLKELWQLVDVVKAKLSSITTPALLVHAENDDIASFKNALYVQKHLNAETKLVLLEKSYHLITVDQERNKVADWTANFAYAQLNDLEKSELKKHASLEIPQNLS